MKNQFAYILVVIILFSVGRAYGQGGCATLTVTSNVPSGDIYIPCDTSKTINIDFSASMNINFPVNETEVYTVNTIPYSPYPWVGANSFVVTSDDIWSPAYPIPFKFCFFDQSYDQFVIGSNGQISFNTARANQGNAWATSGIVAPNNNPDMNNTIMGTYHDILFTSSNGATCTWDTIGVAPCRKLIINWIAPMFSCTNMIDSQQVVLNELTNTIDVNLANKPLCAGWNGGVGHQGIQNDLGTIAHMVPGRNGTAYGPLNNDSWQFAPAGTPYQFGTTYTWRNVTTGSVIGTGSNITISAPFPPGVVCIASIYGGCNSDTTFARDTTLFIQGKVEAEFDVIDDSICLGDPIVISNLSTINNVILPAPNLLINTWDYGDGTVLVDNNALHTHTYAQGGLYTIQLSILDTILGCVDTIRKNVFVEQTPYIEMVASPTTVCLGEPVYFTDSSAPHTVSTTYDFDDGNVLLNNKNPTHTFEQAGVYNVSFSGQYLICPDPEIIVPVTVTANPIVNLGPDTAYCPNLTEPIVLRDVLNPAQILQWSDGSVGPSLTANTFGRYWATANNGNCSSTDSVWVQRDCYLNIPNSFSPNADGSNDYFMPRQILSSGLKEFSMKILNRWGEVIFETDRIDGRGWDGRYGGKDQPVGVYVYLVEARWINNFKNSFKGNVTLFR